MGKTPDRRPGELYEEEIVFEDRTTDGNPTVDGALRYVSNDLVLKTPSGVVSLTTGSGLSEVQHEALDTLAHEIVESSFDEVVYSGNRVDAYIVWETAAKLKKIREELYTYTGNKVTQVIKKQYNGSGTEITAKRLTEVMAYTGNKLDNITRTLGP